jgi:hypothetical protein
MSPPHYQSPQVLGLDLSKYQRRVAILPVNNCTWAGLGSIGCGDYCYTWIKVCGPGVGGGGTWLEDGGSVARGGHQESHLLSCGDCDMHP